MDRREFFKVSSLVGLSAFFPGALFGRSSWRRISSSYEVSLPYSGDVGLWLPIPADTDYQKLTDIRFEGSYRKAGIYTEKLYGSRMLYAHFPKGIGDKRIEVRLSVSFPQGA